MFCTTAVQPWDWAAWQPTPGCTSILSPNSRVHLCVWVWHPTASPSLLSTASECGPIKTIDGYRTNRSVVAIKRHTVQSAAGPCPITQGLGAVPAFSDSPRSVTTFTQLPENRAAAQTIHPLQQSTCLQAPTPPRVPSCQAERVAPANSSAADKTPHPSTLPHSTHTPFFCKQLPSRQPHGSAAQRQLNNHAA